MVLRKTNGSLFHVCGAATSLLDSGDTNHKPVKPKAEFFFFIVLFSLALRCFAAYSLRNAGSGA